MFLRRRDAVFRAQPFVAGLVWLMAAVGGCGEVSPPENDDGLQQDPETQDPFPDSSAEALRFDVGPELLLPAGAEQVLRLTVEPPGEHTVRLAVLGDGAEAFLNESLIVTGSDGVTPPVTLSVLSAGRDFIVRAAVGSLRSDLHVVTFPANTGTLVVTPTYGKTRSVAEWTASVHLDKRCEDLVGNPPPDGSLRKAAPDGAEIRIAQVPVERPLAVVMRAEQFAGGCRNVDPIQSGTETPVSVEVMDRAMHIDGAAVALRLGLELSGEVVPALNELVYRAVTPMAGGAADDLEAVLVAMSLAADTTQDFNSALEQNGWRTLLLSEIGTNLSGTGLRTLVRSWMEAGLTRLTASDAIVGTLRSSDQGEAATLVLDGVAGLAPAAAGFQSENAATMGVERNDFLLIGAPLTWLPSPFLSEVAQREAVAQLPGATSAPRALALSFDCERVAQLLVEQNGNAPPDEAFPGCDQGCVLDLCNGAMDALWARVEGSNLDAVLWDITAAAPATVDAEARPSEVEGTWAGSLSITNFPSGPAPMGGPFAGVKASD
jgi:hypothetical protein